MLRTAATAGVSSLLWITSNVAVAQSDEQVQSEPRWIDQTVEESVVEPAAKESGIERSPRFEAGVLLGGYFAGRDLELGVPDRPGFVSGPRTLNGVAGLRLSVEALPALSIEAETAMVPTADREEGLGATVFAARLHGVLAVDFNGFFAKQFTRPFLLGGLGIASVIGTDGYVDALGNQYGLPRKDTDGEFHVGGGVKWDPHQLVTFRSDIRLYQMPNTKPQGLTATWEITLGASVRFGRSWGALKE